MAKPIDYIPYAPTDAKRTEALTSALFAWYDENKRELPWRKFQDPYSIWISEIMAQQTRITALLPYYERFMKLFPTVEALAQADISQVLKSWEGLGYYARAHNLQKCAKILVEKYNGILPATEKELLALPGIGAYTAGAILSISYQQPYPAVDGNVLRVFARLESNSLDITRPQTRASLTEHIRLIMPQKRTDAFTQSLMELGALVCIPKNPACGQCPVAHLCQALAEGCLHQLPVKTAKKPPKHMDKTVLLLINPAGQVLMHQRNEKLLQGLWEFYVCDGNLSKSEALAKVRALGYTCQTADFIGNTSHIFTHMVWDMVGYACHVAESDSPADYCFINTLADVAIPTAIGAYADWFNGKAPAQLSLFE